MSGAFFKVLEPPMEFYDPVKPDKMALLFAYTCPHCMNEVVLVSPTQAQTVACNACRNTFPIVPVDDRVVQYVHTILADGKAAVDPSF